MENVADYIRHLKWIICVLNSLRERHTKNKVEILTCSDSGRFTSIGTNSKAFAFPKAAGHFTKTMSEQSEADVDE